MKLTRARLSCSKGYTTKKTGGIVASSPHKCDEQEKKEIR